MNRAFLALSVSFFLGLFSLSANAQNTAFANQPKKDRPDSYWVGGHAGMTTGVGLSGQYRRDRVAVQITALPLYVAQEFYLIAGVTPQFTIRRSENVGLFTYASSSVGNIFDRDFRINAGTGLGVDFFAGDFVLFQVMLGYGGLFLNEPRDLLLVPTIGSGLLIKLF